MSLCMFEFLQNNLSFLIQLCFTLIAFYLCICDVFDIFMMDIYLKYAPICAAIFEHSNPALKQKKGGCFETSIIFSQSNYNYATTHN